MTDYDPVGEYLVVGRGARMEQRIPPRRFARPLGLLIIGALALVSSLAVPAAALSGSWSDHLADLAGAAPLAGNGRGVTVSVLDTWVDVSHPNFGGRVSRGVTCSRGRCVPGADRPDTCDPHGTHVSGIVASARYGVAPAANVLPIRVLTSHFGTCAAAAADVALGIHYAIDHKIRIINVSLGSTFPLEDPDRVLPAAVTAAKHAGDLVVVAAGNGKAAAATTYGRDALTVAALGPGGSIASYSQRGAGVDIAAPGGDAPDGNCDPNVCVVSTWQDGGYASDAGTSMAAPFVSGTAALLLSQYPHGSLADVRKTILSTARPLSSKGAGRLDILAAVRLHAPKGAGTHAGTDSPSMTGSGASGDTPSITAAPRAGAPLAGRFAPDQAASDTASSPPSKIRIGPVQFLGIFVVGGVGLAFCAVSGRRTRRQ